MYMYFIYKHMSNHRWLVKGAEMPTSEAIHSPHSPKTEPNVSQLIQKEPKHSNQPKELKTNTQSTETNTSYNTQVQ